MTSGLTSGIRGRNAGRRRCAASFHRTIRLAGPQGNDIIGKVIWAHVTFRFTIPACSTYRHTSQHRSRRRVGSMPGGTIAYPRDVAAPISTILPGFRLLRAPRPAGPIGGNT
jgi:hypothetical protein